MRIRIWPYNLRVRSTPEPPAAVMVVSMVVVMMAESAVVMVVEASPSESPAMVTASDVSNAVRHSLRNKERLVYLAEKLDATVQ